jgi:hypothetical protein
VRIAFDESAIEVHKSKEGLHFVNAFRPWPVCNCFDPLRVHTDIFPTYNEAMEVYLWCEETTLLC